MDVRRFEVFFYGLFMDEQLLAGIHGLLMKLTHQDIERLYYVAKLRSLAERVGLPGNYVASIQ